MLLSFVLLLETNLQVLVFVKVNIAYFSFKNKIFHLAIWFNDQRIFIVILDFIKIQMHFPCQQIRYFDFCVSHLKDVLLGVQLVY